MNKTANMSEYQKKWREEHKEKQKAYFKDYYKSKKKVYKYKDLEFEKFKDLKKYLLDNEIITLE